MSRIIVLVALALPFLGCAKKFADNIPEGCPSNNALTIQSKAATGVTVKQAWYASWGKNGALAFASYDDFDPASFHKHEIAGTEALVVIKLSRADGAEVGKGRYESSSGRDPKPALQVNEFNLSTAGLAGGVFDKSGFVDVTYFGNDFVCGNIKADDGRSKIVGPFITKFKKAS